MTNRNDCPPFRPDIDEAQMDEHRCLRTMKEMSLGPGASLLQKS